MIVKRRLTKDSKQKIKEIVKFIKTHNNFLITTHVRSDGDAAGSVLALNFILKKFGKKSHIVCDNGIAKEYMFLPGAEKIGTSINDLKKNYQGIFVIDCANFDRIEKIKDGLEKNCPVINIDHHTSNPRFGSIWWVDPSFSSCGEMIYELAKKLKVKIDKKIATNLYVAIITDTNRFQFSNTTIYTHLTAIDMLNYGVKPAEITSLIYRQKTLKQLKLLSDFIRNINVDGSIGWAVLTKRMMKKYGFYPQETQEFIDIVKSIKGLKVALLFRELDSGEIKVSIRADKGLNAAEFARKFGGGGHPRAAGFSLKKNMEKTKKIVLQNFKKIL